MDTYRSNMFAVPSGLNFVAAVWLIISPWVLGFNNVHGDDLERRHLWRDRDPLLGDSLVGHRDDQLTELDQRRRRRLGLYLPMGLRRLGHSRHFVGLCDLRSRCLLARRMERHGH